MNEKGWFIPFVLGAMLFSGRNKSDDNSNSGYPTVPTTLIKPKEEWFWDFDFFKKRTSVTAYWAGFLMADGSLGKTGKSSHALSLGVAEKDHNHLKKFCDDIGLSEEAIYKETKQLKG